MHLSNPTVGLAAHFGQVDVRVTGAAPGRRPTRRRWLDEVADEVRRRLGFAVYGEGDQLFEAAIADLLRKRRLSLALVETNTGGELAERFCGLLDGQEILMWTRVIEASVRSCVGRAG